MNASIPRTSFCLSSWGQTYVIFKPQGCAGSAIALPTQTLSYHCLTVTLGDSATPSHAGDRHGAQRFLRAACSAPMAFPEQEIAMHAARNRGTSRSPQHHVHFICV